MDDIVTQLVNADDIDAPLSLYEHLMLHKDAAEEIIKLRQAIKSFVYASNNDDTAGDAFGVLISIAKNTTNT